MDSLKFILYLVFGAFLIQLVCLEPAEKCDPTICTIQTNCRCSDASSPFTTQLDDWPQFITLTFDDHMTEQMLDDVYLPLLIHLVNPDARPISATFFIPHDNTNYQAVNEIYNFGFEVGVNSITKNTSPAYWKSASEETLIEEFKGQKHILSHFANIPINEIQGVRTPQFTLAGDDSIKAYREANFTYDNSWLSSTPLFPYTLDYKSTQACSSDSLCPNEAFPGFWVLPVNTIKGMDGKECTYLSKCGIQDRASLISNWLTNEVDKLRSTTKAPLTLNIDSEFFTGFKNTYTGLATFLKNMRTRLDVFLVSHSQLILYMSNPRNKTSYKSDYFTDSTLCYHNLCNLKKGDETRNMDCCADCPDVYPWLGNPDGNKTVD
ncbi:chitin deacetylase 7-like [Diabrotica undecimpunctata]|uniref:chitin deacetylase 7-like n=1 Tax=Diabrotica undecimpunctata TaxID=50387 RepID=UPI003B639D4A